MTRRLFFRGKYSGASRPRAKKFEMASVVLELPVRWEARDWTLVLFLGRREEHVMLRSRRIFTARSNV